MKVLVVENEARTLNDIYFCLQVRYPDAVIEPVSDGSKVVEELESGSPDLLIASHLPGIDILELIKSIRTISEVPVIILTGDENEIDKAQLLETGADEYASKPVKPMELLSKVRALLRRTQGLGFQKEQVVSTGNGLTINLNTREVLLSGEKIKLTPHEFKLLAELVRNVGKVVTHRILLEKVWGPEYAEDNGFLKKYIYRLRSKLESEPDHPKMLVNERGIGYKLIPAVILFAVRASHIVFDTVQSFSRFS